jgi:CO/xanthine dehydrogenase Mo-binding subunit
MIDVLAQKLDIDKAEIRRRNFIKPEQFPYRTALGWEYDSGDYPPLWTRYWRRSTTRGCAGSRRRSVAVVS